MTKKELLKRIEELQQEVCDLQRRVMAIEDKPPVWYVPSQWQTSPTAKPPFQPPYEITCTQ